MTWQPAPILYPDVELVCATGLRPLLADAGETDVFVGNRIPNPRRDRMVVFNRDGGSASGVIDSPTVRCRVWALADKDANDLAALVAALMPQLADGAPVLSVRKESGPYDVPDESKAFQKYLLFSLRTRGAALA